MQTIVELNRQKIEQIILSEDEMTAAIWEGKVKKYFREKHKDYWDEQEFNKRKALQNTARK